MSYSRKLAMDYAKRYVCDIWPEKSHASNNFGSSFYRMDVIRFAEGWQARFKFENEWRWHRSKDRYATEYDAKLHAVFAALVHALKHTHYGPELSDVYCRAFLGGGS